MMEVFASNGLAGIAFPGSTRGHDYMFVLVYLSTGP